MGFTRFSFSKLWTNPTHFPTVETDESRVRADMQELHDQSKDGLNGLMSALEAQSAAGSLGARAAGGSGKSTVQEQLDTLADKSHSHSNATVLADTQVSLTNTLANSYNRPVSLLKNISAVTGTLGADDTTIPTSKAVQDAIAASGNVPGAGEAGQVLTKRSAANFDYTWDTLTPEGVGALPRDGSGEMTGDLKLRSSAHTASGSLVLASNNTTLRSQPNVNDGTNYRQLMLYSKDTTAKDCLRVFDVAGGKGTAYNILHTGNYSDYALPRDGSSQMTGVLRLADTGGGTQDGRIIQFLNSLRLREMKDSSNYTDLVLDLDTLGFSGVKNGANFAHSILHTGNKPSGSYAGNGSTAERSIQVGGIGGALLIRSSAKDRCSIVTSAGAISIVSDGTVKGFNQHRAQFSNGTLTLKSSDLEFNAAGSTYEYWLL